MGPMMTLLHIAEHKHWQWLDPAPGDYFSYPVVFYEWVCNVYALHLL
jgi:hypothetical protein